MLRSFLSEPLIVHRSILEAVGEVLLDGVGQRLGAAVLASGLLIVRRLPGLALPLSVAQPTRSRLRHVGGPHRRSSADVAEDSPQSAHCDDLIRDAAEKLRRQPERSRRGLRFYASVLALGQLEACNRRSRATSPPNSGFSSSVLSMVVASVRTYCDSLPTSRFL